MFGTSDLFYGFAIVFSTFKNTEVDFKDPEFWDKVLGPRMGERLVRNLGV